MLGEAANLNPACGISLAESQLVRPCSLGAQEARRLTTALGAARDRADLFAGSSESSPLVGQLIFSTVIIDDREGLHKGVHVHLYAV